MVHDSLITSLTTIFCKYVHVIIIMVLMLIITVIIIITRNANFIKKFWPKMDICLEGVNDTCL